MESVAILDFGSQYTQLIARRVRELGVFSRIYPHDVPAEQLADPEIKGVILSGGPRSVHEHGAPRLDPAVLELGKPVLGICYGMQLLNFLCQGTIASATRREYGRATIDVQGDSALFGELQGRQDVWMSHGDRLDRVAGSFVVAARTHDGVVAAIEAPQRALFGLQFHPEVTHTPNGRAILGNFLFAVCGCAGQWTMDHHLEGAISEIREAVGDRRVLVLVSGGVDSTVTAALLARALRPEQVHALHVDSGLMREGESAQVMGELAGLGLANLAFVDASDRFLAGLEGVTDPEAKRRIIGDTFIAVQESEIERLGLAGQDVFLAQGTLYTDLIESGQGKLGATIKTHHNVGTPLVRAKREAGLLLEPNATIFKDEVRELGLRLGLSQDLIWRHPFPGPGLAIRILGEVTPERLALLRQADRLFTEEIRQAGLYGAIWQAFAVLLPVRSVGVMGDARTYESTIALRAVDSADGMTADVHTFPWDVLTRTASRIANEVPGVNRVVYDITSKPPATIEWE